MMNWVSAPAVDGQGNVYVTGSSCSVTGNVSDYLTIKYNPQGQVLWAKTYNGLEHYADHPQALAVDGQGNVYVTGYSSFANNFISPIITTIKYSSDGQELWVQSYYEPDGALARAMTMDSQGNI